jgi:hypothetical protein
MMTNTSTTFFRHLRTIRVICTIAALFISGGFAQNGLIEVRASADPTSITVGDPIVYTLTITHAENVPIVAPVALDNLGAFEVLDFQPLPVSKTEGMINQSYRFTITVYDTGAYLIPSFPVSYQLPDSVGSEHYQIIEADPIAIRVNSVIDAENPELADIRPPRALPGGYRWLWLLPALLLAAAAIWYFFFRNRNRNTGKIFKKETIRPAHEIALEALDSLLQSDLIAKERYKTFFSELSNILRRYIENRFFISAMEETTTEIAQSLQENNISPEATSLAVQALQHCDLVKFARFIPDRAFIDATVAKVRQFIEMTQLVYPDSTAENSESGVTEDRALTEKEL